VALLRRGIGKVNAAVGCALLIDHFVGETMSGAALCAATPDEGCPESNPEP
jgi:hypothetical protein